MQTTHSTDAWTKGQRVQIGFLTLTVLGKHGFAWLLEGKPDVFYSFEPYTGVKRANPCQIVAAVLMKNGARQPTKLEVRAASNEAFQKLEGAWRLAVASGDVAMTGALKESLRLVLEAS